MSVLLDALKKAAEEKNNNTALSEGDSASENESSSEIKTSLDSEIKTPISHDVVSDEVENSGIALSSDNNGEGLPLFTLKDPSEEQDVSVSNDQLQTPSHENPQLNDSDSISLQLQAEPSDNGMSIESTNDGELSDLIDSLDISSPGLSLESDLIQDNTSTDSLSIDVGDDVSFAPDGAETLTYDDQHEPSKVLVGNKKSNYDSEFNWSMDELPGYIPDDSDSSESTLDSLSQNPILINGENKPPKVVKKSSTSVRLVVSLVVILLFIGIGFYGMLYYQEQNDELEFSMKRYNLTKMKLPSNKAGTQPEKPLAKEFEESPSLTASITDKIINVGEVIKNKVSNEVVDKGDKSLNLSEAKDINLTKSNDIGVNKASITKVLSKNTKIAKTEINRKPNTRISSRQGATKSQKVYKPVQENLSKYPNRVLATTSKPYKTNKQTSTVIVSTARSFVSKAYDSYNSGNFTQAQKYFSQALAKDANNINAMFGLAGVSVAQKKYHSAVNLYQQVLDQDANNLYAFESIANLSGMVDLNSQWEKELSSMAKKFPNSSVLQYALGNTYANKKDWLAAQDKYFNAYALDSSNPDYMVNLAVSFDHLGKYELAAKYYTQALGFSDMKNISFDSNKVRDRLVSIRQFIVKGQ